MDKGLQRLKDTSKEISQNIQTIQEQTTNYQASAKSQAQLKIQQLYFEFEKNQELVKGEMNREVAEGKKRVQAEVEQEKAQLKTVFDQNVDKTVLALIKEVIASGHC